MRRLCRDSGEAQVQRWRAVLYQTEAEAQRLRHEFLPSYEVPVVSERIHLAFDFINAWVAEARQLHRLAEREVEQANQGRRG